MKKLNAIILILILSKINAQELSLIKPGIQAPGFVLNLQQNSIQSFSFPYLNRVVLLHFWSTSISTSKTKNKSLNRLTERYKNVMYKTADGFELIAIAVQSDKKAWVESIKNDSLNNFINGIAQRGYNDDICKKYGVTSLPADILIDEKGIVLAINPKLALIEELLDEKKNFLPIKKDVIGSINYLQKPIEIFKQEKLYLFDAYYDTLATTLSNTKNSFTFYDVKLNQDFIIKIGNQNNNLISDTIALFSSRGEHIVNGKQTDDGVTFYVHSNLAYKLTDENADESLNGSISKVNVVKNLIFLNNGTALTPKDEKELQPILLMLQKNEDLKLNITTHSDSKADDKEALTLTSKQAKTIKDYFIKKGIIASRIQTNPKGKSQPRKVCKANTDCSDADHKQNRRVEFLVYKN
ncbi:MAG: OmpA family protein [Bacteroidota bacterium]|nr:OmpA family protein [Bacteroidota bacterium]MDP3143811.1 OmpA family protein [Bacteroidota bacterium]